MVGSPEQLRNSFKGRLSNARTRSDEIFRIVSPSAFYERPIPERHRLVFYLGHLEAFDWNMICRAAFGKRSFDAQLDRLFEFGIDPVNGRVPQDAPSDWPTLDEVRIYNSRIRQRVDECLDRAAFSKSSESYVENGLIFHVALEHRLMHCETLAYMLHWLPFHAKIRGAVDQTDAKSPRPRIIDIPSGCAILGQDANDPNSFGWDNEFRLLRIDVPEFSIDAYSVTNESYMEFIRAGGYHERSFWDDDAWEWIQSKEVRHPKFWIERNGRWFIRTMFSELPLPSSWPVYVSHAEASAYARWVGKSLPTEGQYHRATFGAPDGIDRPYPWGEEPPDQGRGNFDFVSWEPRPVGSFPKGQSAFGVFDLIGNGWEWTSSQFKPFPGFEPFPFYRGYSADFFDGRHFVMKGASARTSASLVRRSFRNWFQPHYPNVYAKFRCVENQ